MRHPSPPPSYSPLTPRGVLESLSGERPPDRENISFCKPQSAASLSPALVPPCEPDPLHCPPQIAAQDASSDVSQTPISESRGSERDSSGTNERVVRVAQAGDPTGRNDSHGSVLDSVTANIFVEQTPLQALLPSGPFSVQRPTYSPLLDNTSYSPSSCNEAPSNFPTSHAFSSLLVPPPLLSSTPIPPISEDSLHPQGESSRSSVVKLTVLPPEQPVGAPLATAQTLVSSSATKKRRSSYRLPAECLDKEGLTEEEIQRNLTTWVDAKLQSIEDNGKIIRKAKLR
ncbi:hypothetical protein DL93DRAFT_1740781 [Clavulina sp. PMI_390]|nr:hypothetical protein DL93DRAFT_1740781 [Clavulina sp. PMI_390]